MLLDKRENDTKDQATILLYFFFFCEHAQCAKAQQKVVVCHKSKTPEAMETYLKKNNLMLQNELLQKFESLREKSKNFSFTKEKTCV